MLFSSVRPALASLVFLLTAALAAATPTLTLQPTDQVTTVGGSASFTLAATVPSGTLSYKWQVSTDNGTTFTDITNGAPYSNATTATLTITGATFALQGYCYRGVATQTGGTGAGAIISTTVTLFQDLATVSCEKLRSIQAMLNECPRRILQDAPPAERFQPLLLSTPKSN